MSDLESQVLGMMNTVSAAKGAAFLDQRMIGKIKPMPEPLPELPKVEPFDYNYLPDGIRGYVKDISERMQCPPDFAAVNTYVMLAAPIGCKIGIRPKRRDNWVIVPNLWGATIGGSGVMKSPNRTESFRPLKKLLYFHRNCKTE